MDKKRIILIAVIAAAALGLIAGIYIASRLGSPEYALKKAVDDVKANGIDALEAHMTPEAWNTVGTAVDAAKVVGGVGETVEDLTGKAFSFFTGRSRSGENSESSSGDSEEQSALSRLIDRVKDVNFTWTGTKKNGHDANVTIQFNWMDKMTGHFDVTMHKSKGKWLISGITMPVFEKTGD